MASPAVTASRAAQWRGRMTPWQRHLLCLVAATTLLILLCIGDVADIVAVWLRTGAFHHCVLLPPILAWLVWQRRRVLALLTPDFWPPGLLLVAGAGLLWLMGAAGLVAIFRQAGVILGVQALVLTLLGLPIARSLRFPLLYALFLIPVGSEVEPLLQQVTAHSAVQLLHLSGTPALLEGVFIATPAGLFRIAEACSGTGFLLAMAAYAALVCDLCFRSPARRALFLSVAMLLALLSNGLRAYAIMQVANLTSMANPIVTDHVLYGWLLFAAVLAALMWVSSRWFEGRGGEAGTPVARALQGVAPARVGAARLLPLLAALIAAPHMWMGLTAPVQSAAPSPPPVAPVVRGWTLTSAGAPFDWQPHFDGATWIGHWIYAGPGSAKVDYAIVVFDRQQEGSELVGFGQGAAAPDGKGWSVSSAAVTPDGSRGEWLRDRRGVLRYVATVYVVDGIRTGSRLEAKLAAVRARLLSGRRDGYAVLVSAPGGVDGEAEARVRAFLAAAGPVERLAARRGATP